MPYRYHRCFCSVRRDCCRGRCGVSSLGGGHDLFVRSPRTTPEIWRRGGAGQSFSCCRAQRNRRPDWTQRVGKDDSMSSPEFGAHGGLSHSMARTFRLFARGLSCWHIPHLQRSRLSLPLSIFDNIMIGNHKRLNQGLWFNLIRRGEFKREFEANCGAAPRSLKYETAARRADVRAVGGLPMMDRRRIDLPSADQSAEAAFARRAIGRHDA